MTPNPLGQDVRYGIRTLGRTPGFTAVAVAVLALGIAANATVFTLANAFFLRPLPVSDTDTLIRVCSNRYSTTSQRSMLEYRRRTSTLSGLAGFQLRSLGLRVDGEIEHSFGEIVSGEYFTMLGVTAARGRLFGPDDDRPDAAPVAVLSHAFWTRRFGASPDAIGRTIALNGATFTVVGVASPDFTGLMSPLRGDLWVPLSADALLRPALDPAARMDSLTLHLIGRLKPGVDRVAAQADLDTIGRQLRAAAGQDGERGQAVTVYAATTLHPEIAPPVAIFTGILMAAVALVLLIVCVNVANLVLARAAGRGAELAIRQSLGAARGRLIRQLLTENLLLSGAGAALGLALAFWLTRLAMSVRLPAPVPLALDLTVDIRVMAFTALVAIAATLAFGIVPALAVSRVDLVSALKGTQDGRRHGWLRTAFLVAQVSMSVLLLITAGLFIRDFRNTQSLDLGFETARVQTASIDLETRGYTEARGRELVRALVERLEAAPGVVAASVLDIVPVTLSNRVATVLRDGDPDPVPGQEPVVPMVYMNTVGPGHFKTLEIGMVAGRDFTYYDGPGSTPVAIVNETLARRFWPGRDAIGQRLRPMGSGMTAAMEVVGVVRDSKYVTANEAPRPFMYRPFAQEYTSQVTLLVRAAGAPSSTLPTIAGVVRGLDPGLVVFNASSLTDATALSLLPTRVAGNLLGALGVMALVLAALGIYGVLSVVVQSRTREIGVRVALGATPQSVAGMVVRQAMTWTAAGMVLGLGLAIGVTRFLAALLFGISPTDPWVFGGVILLLSLVAFTAALVPALRASRLNPIAALRHN